MKKTLFEKKSGRIFIFLFSMAIFIFSLFQLKNLSPQYSTEDLIEPKIESIEAFRRYQKSYDESYKSLFILRPKNQREYFSEKELCSLNRFLNQYAKGHREMNSYFTLLNVRTAQLTEDKRLLFPSLLPLDCPTPHLTEQQILLKLNQSKHQYLENTLLPKKVNDFIVEVSYEKKGKIVKDLDHDFSHFIQSQLKNVKVYSVGLADYNLWVENARKKTSILHALLFIGMAIGIRLILGTWISGFFFIASLFYCLVIIFGLKAFFHSPTDILSDNIVPLLAISTLEDFIFASYVQFTKGYSWEESLRSVKIPSFWTSLTTAIGFGSLVVSDLHLIQRFGLWSAIGVMLEWFLLFVIFPKILPLFYNHHNWIDLNHSILHTKAHLIQLIGKKIKNPANALVLTSFFAVPAFIYFAPPLNVSDSLDEIFVKSHPYTEGLEYLKETRGWKSKLDIEVDGQVTDEAFFALLDKMKRDKLIIAFDDPHSFKNFELEGVDKEYMPLANRMITNTDQWDKYFDKNKLHKRATLYLPNSSTQYLEKISSAIKENCLHLNCKTYGQLLTKAEFTDTISSTFIESAIVSLILITLTIVLLAIYLKKIRDIFPMVIASLWAPLTLYAVVKLFSIPINLVSCIVITLVLGLTGDSVIQFMFNKGKDLEQGIESLKGGAVCCFLLMAILCTVFLMTPFLPVKTMGILASFGLVSILIGDIYVLKFLLKFRKNLAQH